MSLASRAIAVLVLTFALGFSGCAAKKTKSEEEGSVSGTQIENADVNLGGDSDNGKAMGMKTITFPYDSFNLSEQAKGDLKNNSDILKTNANVKVQIEGHCDARGGIQYNIALGEKRANSVKAFLADLGINADRISTVSMGKEKLLDNGSSEEAHAKNRRANFVVTSN